MVKGLQGGLKHQIDPGMPFVPPGPTCDPPNWLVARPGGVPQNLETQVCGPYYVCYMRRSDIAECALPGGSMVSALVPAFDFQREGCGAAPHRAALWPWTPFWCVLCAAAGPPPLRPTPPPPPATHGHDAGSAPRSNAEVATSQHVTARREVVHTHPTPCVLRAIFTRSLRYVVQPGFVWVGLVCGAARYSVRSGLLR